MADETDRPPLARRVPGATRAGPADPERRKPPELPEEFRQRIQAVVSAAHVQQARELDAQKEQAGQSGHSGRNKTSARLGRRASAQADGPKSPNGLLQSVVPNLRHKREGRLSDEDAEFDTDRMPRLTASGAIANPPAPATGTPSPDSVVSNGELDQANGRAPAPKQERREQHRQTVSRKDAPGQLEPSAAEQRARQEERAVHAERERAEVEERTLEQGERHAKRNQKRTARQGRAADRVRAAEEKRIARQELARALQERAREEQERAAQLEQERARQEEERAAKERIRLEQELEDRQWAAQRRARQEREREEAEARARLEQQREEAEERARQEQERTAQLERERAAQLEQERTRQLEEQARQEEERARLEQQRKETEERERQEAEALRRQEQERTAQLERERTAQLERERTAQLERERTAQLERERTAQLERERAAQLEQERTRQLEEQARQEEERARLEQQRKETEERERQEAEALRRQEQERTAQLERERTAQLERERTAQLERERTAQLERERAAQLEQERTRQLEEQARQEEERARLEQQRKETEERERQEAEALRRQEQERTAQLERERTAQLERERTAQLERERTAQLERERAAQLEQERTRQEREREETEERGRQERETAAAKPERPAKPAKVPERAEKPAGLKAAAAVLTAPDKVARPEPRKSAGLRRRRAPAAIAAAAVLLASGSLIVARSLHSSGHTSLTPAQVSTVTRKQAAAWVAQQVTAAMVSCDPVMCRALKAQGVPTHDLLVVGPSTATPFGSQVVVATAAIRNRFGSRLTSVYAPAVIASFGSGNSRIDVRVIAAKGAAAYMSQLRADEQDRRTGGPEMLASPRITTSPMAESQLAAGRVDSRLMLLFSFLTSSNELDIVAFGDSGPGATAGMPLRSATLVGSAADLRSILAFLHTSEAPYRPAHAQIMHRHGRSELEIEFSAPSPLGLFENAPP